MQHGLDAVETEIQAAPLADAAGPIEDVFGKIDLGAATGRHEAGALMVAEIAGEEAEFALTRLYAGGAELVVPSLGRAVGSKVRLRVRSQDVAIALTPTTPFSRRSLRSPGAPTSSRTRACSPGS